MSDKKIATDKKHLFGSSEKSDFILNMTTKSAQKLCGMYSMIAIAIITLFEIPYYFTQHVVDYVDEQSGAVTYVGDTFAFYISTMVIAAGLIGFLIFLVAHMKNEVKVSDNRLLAVIVVIIGVSVWSMFSSTQLSYSFFGYLDRSEGLLTLLAYWGFFAVGMTVTADSWRVKLSDFIVGLGTFNALIGILQSISAFDGIIPNTFENLFVRMGTNAAEGEIAIEGQGLFEKANVATGFFCTPYALAAVMTITFAFALAGAMYDNSKRRKYLYEISALVCAAASFLTDVVSGIIGIAVVAVVMLIVEVARLIAQKKGRIQIVMWAVVTVLSGVMACTFFATDIAKLRDEQIIFTDTYYRLSISSYQRDDKSENIYPYLWNDSTYVIEQNPVVGVGPDNWSEMNTVGNVIDRAYNEYLDIAAQRGILCLVFYLFFIAVTIGKMFCALKNFLREKEEFSFTAVAVFTATTGYLVQAFFNISSNYSSPYFYLILGVGWSYFAVKKVKNKI